MITTASAGELVEGMRYYRLTTRQTTSYAAGRFLARSTQSSGTACGSSTWGMA